MRAPAFIALSLAALSLLACADDDPPVKAVDSVDSGGCLDKPDVLPRPPQGRLPCELLPPGFGR